MKKNREWFVTIGNEATNNAIFQLDHFDPYTDFLIDAIVFEKEGGSGQYFFRNVNLARVSGYEMIARLNEHKKRFGLKFSVYVRDSQGGKIYQWFDKKKNPKNLKKKV